MLSKSSIYLCVKHFQLVVKRIKWYKGGEGDDGVEVDTPLVTSVLGMKWNIQEDFICFSVKLNFSRKKGKQHIEPNICEEDILHKFPEVLTRRMVVSQVNGFYDPLGLAAPTTVAAKILVRKLWIGEMKSKGWDDAIPEDQRLE